MKDDGRTSFIVVACSNRFCSEVVLVTVDNCLENEGIFYCKKCQRIEEITEESRCNYAGGKPTVLHERHL